MSALLEAALQVHLLLTLLHLFQKFLRGLPPIRLSISVHETHVVNTVCPILPEVPEQKVSLMFRGLWQSVLWVCGATGPIWIGFRHIHGATLVDQGLLRTCEGVKALPTRSETLSWSSL